MESLRYLSQQSMQAWPLSSDAHDGQFLEEIWSVSSKDKARCWSRFDEDIGVVQQRVETF